MTWAAVGTKRGPSRRICSEAVSPLVRGRGRVRARGEFRVRLRVRIRARARARARVRARVRLGVPEHVELQRMAIQLELANRAVTQRSRQPRARLVP